MSWIISNIGTIIVALALIAIVAAIILSVRKDKKAGKSCSCGCGCSSCAMKGHCHSAGTSTRAEKR